jgi:hypothetical protein
MAALLNIYRRRAFPVLARTYVPRVRALTALKLAVCYRTRPKLVLQWRVGSDGRPTGSWVSEASAALKNPDD